MRLEAVTPPQVPAASGRVTLDATAAMAAATTATGGAAGASATSAAAALIPGQPTSLTKYLQTQEIATQCSGIWQR